MNAKTNTAPEAGAENPAPAKGMDSASVLVSQRTETTAQQSARDMNDPRRRKPNDRDFAGQGIDPTPYGHKTAPKAKKGRK